MCQIIKKIKIKTYRPFIVHFELTTASSFFEYQKCGIPSDLLVGSFSKILALTSGTAPSVAKGLNLKNATILPNHAKNHATTKILKSRHIFG